MEIQALRTVSRQLSNSYGEKSKPSFDPFKIISRKKYFASMLICYQGPLCPIFIKIQRRDPEMLDPENAFFAFLTLTFWVRAPLISDEIGSDFQFR